MTTTTADASGAATPGTPGTRQWPIDSTPSPRLSAAAAGTCLLAFALLAMSVSSAAGELEQQWSQTAAALGDSTPWLSESAWLLARLGSSPVVVSVVCVVALLLLRAGHRGWAGWLLACTLGGLALTHLTKALVHRDRPPDGAYVPMGASFPSGHTTAGIYGWVALGVVALALLSGAWRVLGWTAITVGLLMGPSRLVLGVHWPGDVLAGLLLGSAWVLAVSAVALARAQRVPPPPVSADTVPG